MTNKQLERVGILLFLCVICLPVTVCAQAQKFIDPHQKEALREPYREPPQEPLQGGYQAPPPTGAMRGATRELGLSGGEIELPAIRLRLPRIRFPAFSFFVTPPQMETERGVAPVVQQVQQQISVPTGTTPRTEPLTAPPAEPLTEPRTQPFTAPAPAQKVRFEQQDSDQVTSVSRLEEPTQFGSLQMEMDQFERRIDQRLARLEAAIELLVADRHGEHEQVNGEVRLAPFVEKSNAHRERPSSYNSAEPARSINAQSQLRRLPDP